MSTTTGETEMSMTFIYTVNRVGRTVSVVAAGEIDVAAAGPFGTALCRLAESEPTDLIEVDLGGLRFIDSTGTAALKRAYRATRRHGCSLAVVNATGLVRRVLDLTGTPHADTAPVHGRDSGVPHGV
jgi:anti-anti-sigma factor